MPVNSRPIKKTLGLTMDAVREWIESPSQLRQMPAERLPMLADELRQRLIHSVSQTGGHFSSNLGTVELTLALHFVFNTPEDRLIWDVGHQAYIHKMLTGRRNKMSTIRQQGGLSGNYVKENELRNCLGNLIQFY